MFDIVIPVGPNDTHQLKEQIIYTKKNIIGYRKIYIIAHDKNIEIDQCIIIDENSFPFTINDIAKYHGKYERNGWYLQQLLKLYAGFIIPGILDRYLVIDSDTYFMKPITFIEDNKCLYNYGTEYHEPYFIHMKKLHDSLEKLIDKSGICHHMIFEKKYMEELFTMTEQNHQKKFWIIFIENVDCNDAKNGSGASEYEIYFNFMLKYHKNDIKIRPLKWINSNSILNYKNKKYDYVSCHWYLR